MALNKKANYLLVPLVIAIWGMAIYRIVEAVSPQEETDAIAAKLKVQAPKKDGEIWTDSLQLDYADPFLRDNMTVETAEIPRQNALEASVPQELSWPEMQYLGEIKSAHSGRTVVLLRVNGQSKMLRTGDELQGITYLGRTKHGVILEYQGRRKEISQ